MSVYNWTLKSSLNPSYSDINSFTMGLYRALESSEGSVAINLSQIGTIKGEMSTVLLSGIRQLQSKNKEVRLVGVKPAQKEFFERNGLYEAIGFKHKPDDKNTTIQLREFHVSNDEMIEEYINTLLIPKLTNYSKNAPTHEQKAVDEMVKSVRYAIEELVDNIKTHSGSELMYFAGQFFPRQKRLSLTILDAGLTIPTIVRNKFYNTPDEQLTNTADDVSLIAWATEQGNTTKDVKENGIPGGVGLYTIKNSLENHGELTIASKNGFWKLTSSGKVMQQTLYAKFPGTLLHVTFILDSKKIDKDSFSLPLLF